MEDSGFEISRKTMEFLKFNQNQDFESRIKTARLKIVDKFKQLSLVVAKSRRG